MADTPEEMNNRAHYFELSCASEPYFILVKRQECFHISVFVQRKWHFSTLSLDILPNTNSTVHFDAYNGGLLASWDKH